MTTLQDLEIRIKNIEIRNALVEQNKGWETSTARKIIIAVLTYMGISIFFLITRVEKPILSAIVPTLGFLLSTLSLGIFKKIWLKINNSRIIYDH